MSSSASVSFSRPRLASALRVAASCHAAAEDHAAEAEAHRQVLELGGESDNAQNDRVSYALALASAGQRDKALEELKAQARKIGKSGSSNKYAKKRKNKKK